MTDTKQYGFWTVLDRGVINSICRCKCGVEKQVANRSLRQGSSRSCGCASSLLRSGAKEKRRVREMVRVQEKFE